MVEIAIIAIVVSLASVIVSILVQYSTNKRIDKTVEIVSKSLREHVDNELEPLITKVNRAFGMKSEASTQVRQLKTAERYIAQDLLEAQDPLIKAGLELISPRTKEYIEKNPDLLLQLIPRIQALMQMDGFNPAELISPGGSGTPKKHPFGFDER